MLAILTLSAALAAPTPEELDDVARWQAAADRLIDGPAGCWIFEGDARQTFVLHQAPDRFSIASDHTIETTGPFVARLQDGVWERIDYRRTYSDPEQQLDVDLTPLVGKPGEEGSGSMSISLSGDGAQVAGGVAESMNLLRQAIEEWTGSVETSYAKWDAAADAVRFVREVAVTESANELVRVTSTFPAGGAHATEIEAVWPKQMKVGEWPFRIALRDPQMHVLGFVHDEQVLPNAESVSVVIGVLGFTVGYEQHLRYLTAAPCSGSSVAPAEPTAPEPQPPEAPAQP